MTSGVWVACLLTSLIGVTPASVSAHDRSTTPVPLVVADGTTSMSLAGGTSGRSYLAVVGSLVPRGKESPLVVRSRPVVSGGGESVSLPVQPAQPRPSWWTWRVENDQRQMERARQAMAGGTTNYTAARLASLRTFHLFVGEDDLYDTKKYAPVQAKLAKTGKWCLIYTDVVDKVSPELLEEVATTFDERVYPNARRMFGEHRDVDRNGKFTILITGWLDRLSAGKVALSGFVRGADFYRDVAAPYSNQCDMMYLNASLSPGEHLRTVLAHEYTHAITFSEHTFAEYLPGANGQDEEAWLGEAMAHVAENYHGDGWSNLDYRISTYLSDTGAYRLVVPDYFQDGLWRSHGCRGATYLFLRYLVDRFGPELLTKLSRSNLEGIANIETATQTPFAELFRDWSVQLATSGMSHSSMTAATMSVPIHGRLGERLLAGPRPLIVEESPVETTLAPTSWTSVLIHIPAGQKRQLEIVGDSSADLQVTIVPMPEDQAMIALHVTPADRSVDAVQLQLQSDRPVRWQSVSWERAKLRQEKPRGNEKIARIMTAQKILGSEIPTSRRLISQQIDVAEFDGDPIVFKLVGVDPQGRNVSAWATYTPQESVSELLQVSGTTADDTKVLAEPVR